MVSKGPFAPDPSRFEADFISGTEETLNSGSQACFTKTKLPFGGRKRKQRANRFLFKKAEWRLDQLLGQTEKGISPSIFNQASFKSRLSGSEPRGGAQGSLCRLTSAPHPPLSCWDSQRGATSESLSIMSSLLHRTSKKGRGQLIVHRGRKEEPGKPQHRSSGRLPPPSVQPSTRSSRLPRRHESKVTERS